MGCFGTFSFRPLAVGAHTTTADLKTLVKSFFEEVPAEGLEPTRPCGHWILSPARLPIPPRRRLEM